MNVYKKTSKTCCNRAHIGLRELAQILTRAMKTTKLGWDGGGGRPGRHMRVVLRDAARQGKIRGTKTPAITELTKLMINHITYMY